MPSYQIQPSQLPLFLEPGFAYLINDQAQVLSPVLITLISSQYSPQIISPLPLSVEILKDNLGFKVDDMGDFWQCQKDDFLLNNAKFILSPKKIMPFVHGFKTTVPRGLNFTNVHHLQAHFLFTRLEKLPWISP
jgi:hypothetical protein